MTLENTVSARADAPQARPRTRARVAALVVLTLLLGGMSALVAPTAALADTPTGPGPVVNPTAGTVTGDALPTVQIDGVVWSQAVVGTTVYVGGEFKNARPAGSAPGQNLTPRSNLLAYDLTTGNLVTSFAPVVNAQVKTVVASPDGSRVYIGGTFTSVNGVARDRVAAFSTATGALLTTFIPHPYSSVKAIAATNSTVYVGGAFTVANGQTRNRLAAFSASNGALLGWNPGADATVNALQLTPDGSKLIVGGAFANVNGAAAYGLAAVDPTSSALLPWAAGATVRNAGANAAILSLKTDGTTIYGTGYAYGAGGNLEGTFAADPATGAIAWVEDCHGDTYDSFPVNGVVYTVSHAHYCGNVGGFPQSDPWSTNMRHAVAFTAAATGTLGADPLGYFNWVGTPSPSMVNWFPELAVGSYTGATQAAWSITGNSQYITLGGEFPQVNQKGQQGLVRFAVKPVAPAKVAPKLSGAAFPATAVGRSTGAVRVSWQSNWDIDDATLTYKVVRNGNTAAPVYQVTADSTFWNRPTLGYVDTTVTPGTSYTYRVYATDSAGNTAPGDPVTVTAPPAGGSNPYAAAVVADGARTYWPLDEPSGSVAFDGIGFNDADQGAGVGDGAAGAVAPGTAATFSGASTATMSTRTPAPATSTFTTEAWFRTTSTSGGKIVGFGRSATGSSSSYDRHTYLDNAGHVLFGVYNGGVRSLTSAGTYNDGAWHQVVSTLGAGGMTLYVDGRKVASRADTTASSESYDGYWRVGGDNLGGWTNQPSSTNLAGSIDEVALYPTALTPTQVGSHYAASGRPSPFPAPPTDSYGSSVYSDAPSLYWRLGETTGTTAVDATPNGSDGTYLGSSTRGAAGAVPGGGTAVTFDGSSGAVASTVAVTNPTTYSLESWFSTTTTRGGKIIGFGDRSSGLSSHYDRHVYLQDDGRLVFGTYTSQTNTITTAARYNDGAYHHVVATQGADGMKLYVDGQLVGTNPQTQAESYTGYWRVGGDPTWGSSSPWFAGTIDEAAVYPGVLSAARVSQHHDAGSGVQPNAAPTAAFASSAADLVASFDGAGSTDADGTVASWAWTYGDGTSGTGRTSSHTYAAAGTYTVALTVTDDEGATGTVSKPVTVTAPAPVNTAPMAAFTPSTANLVLTADARASTDADGTVASWAWTFGDGTTGTGSQVGHTYPAAGTYTVTLVVTDDKGATDTVTRSVTVTAAPPTNRAPTAAFTTTVANLAASFDAAGSTDPDGTVVAWAWTYGDGTSGTGRTSSRTYATAGSYPVTLTVTDDKGATSTVSQAVTVTAPPAGATVLAADTFTRTTTNGLGSADTGGAWTASGTPSWFAVTGGVAQLRMTAAGAGPAAFLNAVSATDVNLAVSVSLDKTPTGGGTYLTLAARRVGTTDYRLNAIVKATSVTLTLTKTVNGTATTLRSQVVTGLGYTAGDVLRLRLQVTGTGTTALTGKVWNAAAAEPTAWQVSATDTEAGLQRPGGVGVQSYLSGSSTNAPQVASIDDLSVTSPAAG